MTIVIAVVGTVGLFVIFGLLGRHAPPRGCGAGDERACHSCSAGTCTRENSDAC